MRSGTGFSDILDEQLARSREAWPASRVAAAAPIFGRPGPSPAILFGAAATVAGATRATVSAAYAQPSPRTTRPAAPRALSPGQKRALDCLRTLGVPALDESFTEAELKTAFRSLARSLHPDRHLHASEHERQHLSRCFARACDAYRELSRALVH